MARHFRGRDVALRFIEYMDVGATNGWRMDEVLPSAEVVAPHRRRVRARAAAGFGARRDGASAGATPSRRRRRDRHDLERHAGVLPRLQPGPPVDRRQALPVPVREPAATTCARWCAAAPATPRSRRRSAWSGKARGDRYSELRGAAPARRAGRRAARRDALHRRVSGSRRRSGRSPPPTSPTTSGCATRCSRAHPEAFTSDAESEASKEPTDYLHAPRPRPRATAASSCSAPGAASSCVGAIGCEREARLQGAPHRPRHRHDGARRTRAAPASARLLARGVHRRGAPRRPRDADAHGDRRERQRGAASTSATASSPTARCAAPSRSAAATTTSCTWRSASERRRARRRLRRPAAASPAASRSRRRCRG